LAPCPLEHRVDRHIGIFLRRRKSVTNHNARPSSSAQSVLYRLDLCVPHARLQQARSFFIPHTPVMPNRHLRLTWHARHRCAPPRASPSCATEPGPCFRTNRVFIAHIFRTSVGSSLSSPAPRPPLPFLLTGACVTPLMYAPTAHTPLVTSGIESRNSPRTAFALPQIQTRTSSHQRA